jgi:hypothetical protein
LAAVFQSPLEPVSQLKVAIFVPLHWNSEQLLNRTILMLLNANITAGCRVWGARPLFQKTLLLTHENVGQPLLMTISVGPTMTVAMREEKSRHIETELETRL